MANQLDAHGTKLKKIIAKFGRSVNLTDLSGPTVYLDLVALWNDVEHVLKVENLSENPMGERSSIYIDRDSLQTESGEIVPVKGWEAFGSPNKYDAEETYVIEIPKQDRQLPALLMFLSKKNTDAEEWPTP